MKTWLCIICGLIYDEAKGWPDDGIAPGTRWEDVPEDWLCPECKVGKADFEMIELSTPIAAVATAPVIQAQPLVAARPAPDLERPAVHDPVCGRVRPDGAAHAAICGASVVAVAAARPLHAAGRVRVMD